MIVRQRPAILRAAVPGLPLSTLDTWVMTVDWSVRSSTPTLPGLEAHALPAHPLTALIAVHVAFRLVRWDPSRPFAKGRHMPRRVGRRRVPFVAGNDRRLFRIGFIVRRHYLDAVFVEGILNVRQ